MVDFLQIIYWAFIWIFLSYSVVVAIFDLYTRKIDNKLIGLGMIIGFTISILRCFLLGSLVPLLTGIAGFFVCFGIYFGIHLMRSGQFGAGDVKLAAVVGLFVGSLGFAESLLAVLGGFVLAMPAALYYIITGDRSFRLPFAPFLLGSCWLIFTLYSN
jgi:leader peptidase (prepilin peptidase)/N-methyltransferase